MPNIGEMSFEEKVEAMIVKAGEVWRCIECGRVGATSEELTEKIADDWICVECGRVASRPEGLTLKVGDLWKCKECGRMAEDSRAKWRLRRHVETHLTDVTHSCTVCGHTSKTSGGLEQHMAKRHPELKVYVRTPKAKGPKGINGKVVMPSSPKHATSLDEVEERAEALIALVGEMLYCGDCGKAMPKEKKWAMRRHVEVHLVGMSFVCELCGKHSKSTHGLYQHKAKNHPELKIIKQLTANFKCDICGKGSKTEKGLSNHKWKYHRGGKTRSRPGAMEMKLEQNMMSLLASEDLALVTQHLPLSANTLL